MKKWFKVTGTAEWLVKAEDADEAELIAGETGPDTVKIDDVWEDEDHGEA